MASRHPLLGPSLTIACATCPVRGHACEDCMVTAMLRLAPPGHDQPAGLALDHDERIAVDALVRSGLVARAVGDAARARRIGPTERRAVG